MSRDNKIPSFRAPHKEDPPFSALIGVYRVLPGFTGIDAVWLVLYPLWPGFVGFHWFLPGFTGFGWVWLGFTRFYLVLPGFT